MFRQSDIGHREDKEHQRIKRHPIDQPAIGRDLTGMHAVIDNTDTEKQRARHDAMDIIWNTPPATPCMVPANIPMVTKPMWATDE